MQELTRFHVWFSLRTHALPVARPELDLLASFFHESLELRC
jgi:hypothetical protein